MSEKCLNPNCQALANARGLCHSCYGVAHRLVNAKRTTWQDLEARGKVLPKTRNTVVKNWFMEGGQ